MIFKLIQRTYYDIYNALKTAYASFPDWLWIQMAGFFENISELVNNIATDLIDPFSRESAYGFAANNDYPPIEADGATATETITLTGAMVKTLTAGYQIGGVSSVNNQLMIYELTADASSGGTDTITGTFKQKKTVTVNIGTVESNDDYYEMPIDGYTNIIKDSISLLINALTWTRVDNFDDSTASDRHFVIIYQSNGKARIQFGDGTTGDKPPLNEVVTATFSTTFGAIGRLGAGEINLNIGGDSDISSVTNASAAVGGNDAEGVSAIIRNARANVRLRDAVWYQADVEDAARQADSTVVKAFNQPEVGVINVQIIPSGGGTPSACLKTTVETYVQGLSQFRIVPTNALDPSYKSATITATVTARSGFTLATVQDLVDFALQLTSSSYDNEFIEYYDANGIDDTRTVKINPLLSFSFTSDENEALEFIINNWKDLLGDREYREWGQLLEVGDLWQMGNALYDYGADVFTLTLPTSNVTPLSTEIISGSVTVS